MFLSVDGVDGAGKSTQLQQLVSWLESRDVKVVQCRDPGGTPLGEVLRELILHGLDIELTVCSEMLLYMAARAQLVHDTIRPALASGQTVVCDRFLMANIVYQGHAGGMSLDAVRQVGQVATGGLVPDMTFLLDLPARRAAERIQREPDRMESRGPEFMERVRQGFLAEAARDPERVAVIDADRTAEAIHSEIRAVAESLLDRSSG